MSTLLKGTDLEPPLHDVHLGACKSLLTHCFGSVLQNLKYPGTQGDLKDMPMGQENTTETGVVDIWLKRAEKLRLPNVYD